MNLLLLDQSQSDRNLQPVQVTDQRQLNHIRQHLKLAPGDCIKIGQYNGLTGTAVIEHITPRQLTLSGLQLQHPPPAKLPLTLVLALPRPKALRRLIMDATSLGVEQICLIHSYRVEKSYWQTPFLRQLDDYITLGLEQAGDTVPPRVALFTRFRPFVEDILPQLAAPPDVPARQVLLAHPYASQPMPYALNQPAILVIGPEGGFIPFEVELLQAHGCQAVTLGRRILRCETAITHSIGRLFV